MESNKKTVLLVGALEKKTSNGIGGVRYACQSLLESPLSKQVNWLLLDTTVPITAGLLKRGVLAFSRIVRLLYYLIFFPGVNTVLIFGNYDLTSFSEKGVMVLISKAFRKRTVLSLRTEIRKYQYDRWFTLFRQWVFTNCDRIICQSSIAAKKLVELTRCAPVKVTIIMNWINDGNYAPSTKVSLSHSSDTHEITFIFVGHLTANKAPDVLLNAAKILKERGLPFRLVFCGQGPLYEKLQKDVFVLQLTTEVELRGWVVDDALINALWDADVFVLPTHSEGMPNALLEAMAAGLPVITTPVSSIPEIVTENENGLFVQPSDPIGLADAMEKMISSPQLREKMRKNNTVRIKEKHTVDNVWPLIADML